MNKNSNPRISRNDATGEWTGLIEGKTIYKWDGQLWTGLPSAQGYTRSIELTPMSEADRKYLDERGALSGLISY